MQISVSLRRVYADHQPYLDLDGTAGEAERSSLNHEVTNLGAHVIKGEGGETVMIGARLLRLPKQQESNRYSI